MKKISDQWDDTLPTKAADAWNKASVKDKEEAVIHATSFIDTLPFRGKKLKQTQGLSWPRTGVFRDDGYEITGVPDAIKSATSLVAGFILAKIPFGVPAIAWVFKDVGHLLKEDIPLSDPDITWH